MDNRKIILTALQYFQTATEAVRSGMLLLNEIVAGYLLLSACLVVALL